MFRSLPVVPVLLAALLAGCSMFGGNDEEEAAARAAAVASAVPVDEVVGIEIGRTSTGILVTAYGFAPGIGYGAPELRARRGGAIGTDGFLDYDLVARPPDSGFGLPASGDPRARLVRADRLFGLAELRGATGLRVHGGGGGRQVLF